MAKDMSDTVRDALGGALRQAVKSASDVSPAKRRSSPLSGARGIAAGAGLAAAAPLAKKGVDKLRAGGGMPSASGMASKAGDRVGSKLKDTVSEKVDEAGGAGGMVKDAASGLLGGGGDGGGSNGMPGVGKGRRMPIQQSVDVAVPIETAYNQFTQFEDWPNFMHRVTRVTQSDDTTIDFASKIWGKTKEFQAKIDTQRPDERIKWKVAQGITHSGVVTFHELAPRLTRVEVTLDVAPGSLLEKAARGMRHIKRAVRADLARYKAFIEMQELETGAWRGVIEDGELVEPHDDSYDEERDYSEIEDIYEDGGDEDEDEDDSARSNGNGNGRDEEGSDGMPMPPRSGTGRFKRESSGTGRSRTAAASGSGSSSRSASSSAKSKPKAKASSSGKSSSSRSGGKSSSSRSGGKSSSSRSSGKSSSSSSNGKSTASRSRGSGSGSGSGTTRSRGSSSSSRRKASSRS
ncbi:MAG: hypothetical protein QOE28_447 [Solirubrobacteraceae bacterium]|nr:hypothetical protein [Solirubrobacteraceae bacterium]